MRLLKMNSHTSNRFKIIKNLSLEKNSNTYIFINIELCKCCTDYQKLWAATNNPPWMGEVD